MKTIFQSIKVVLTLALTVGTVAMLLTSCGDKTKVPDTLAFVGSQACQECHTDIYDMFMESGHPYKLNKVVDGKQPVIPFTTAAGVNIPTPAGYTWSDITYMIGGYGWKARFLDSKGYIITKNPDTQYNLEDGSQVAYTSEEIGTKKYDCGRCHTTGWKSVADGGSPQDGLEGMDGEFAFGGVHCEQCHGMGNIHAVTEDKADISVDNSALFCGGCHYRNSDHTIAASGGFIKHHEQYDEMISGKHKDLTCVTCHDPHASVVYDDKALGNGVTKECTECHTDAKYAKVHNGATCIDCHMPMASKSAIKHNIHSGDIKTHIFKINTAADGKMFSDDGSIANPNGDGVTLDFICYKCHQDENGVGGSGSQKSLTTLSLYATDFHNK